VTKVAVHGGLTFQIGAMSSNQYAKLDVELSDLDSDKPLKPQIDGGKRVAQEAFKFVLEELDRQAEEVYAKSK
jgi:hypothetical protein